MSEQNGDLVIDPLVGLIVAIALIAILVLVVFVRRAPSAKLDMIDARIKAAEDKLDQVEHDLKNVRLVVNNQPTARDIDMVGTRISGIEMVLKTNTHSLTRIEDFLMQTAGHALVGRLVEPKDET